jgi:hypothetical protein
MMLMRRNTMRWSGTRNRMVAVRRREPGDGDCSQPEMQGLPGEHRQPRTGKNVLTVGAGENVQAMGAGWLLHPTARLITPTMLPHFRAVALHRRSAEAGNYGARHTHYRWVGARGRPTRALVPGTPVSRMMRPGVRRRIVGGARPSLA